MIYETGCGHVRPDCCCRFADRWEPWQIPCKNETANANFELKAQRHVLGELKDQTAAPFQDSIVILRKEDKGKFVEYRTVNTDKQGRFDLKVVDADEYRFLPAPNRGFKQQREFRAGRALTVRSGWF